MGSKIVLGAQFGDEGKGKIVDVLAEKADIIARFQGGNNAGHTLIYKGKPLVCHLVPCGILHSNKVSVIGNGVVIDLEELKQEISMIEDLGIEVKSKNFMISNKSHIILPLYRKIDKLREQGKGDGKIGTTLRGIGPAYELKAMRTGLRMGDLLDNQVWLEKLQHLYDTIAKERLYDSILAEEPFEKAKAELEGYSKFFSPYVKDLTRKFYDWNKQGKRILLEGAQGAMLDVDHGTYPFVTSSNTTAGGACAGAGISPRFIDKVVGVAKAYVTRVGSGVLTTEINDDNGKMLMEIGREYGATTGRVRRCGWLDLVALKYAVEVNGIDELILTKLDVLSSFDKIKYCKSYLLNGEKIDQFPSDYNELCKVEPLFEEFEGWKTDIAEIRDYQELPSSVRSYIQMISAFLDVKISLISVGPGREHIIRVDEH